MTRTVGRRPALTCDVFAKDEGRIRSVAARAIDSPTAQALAASFKLLGSPMRVRIVDALALSELCVCDLAVLLDTKISALSHQLALMKEHRIVRSRREGKMVFYSLDDHHVQSLFEQALVHSRHDRTPRHATRTDAVRPKRKSPRREKGRRRA